MRPDTRFLCLLSMAAGGAYSAPLTPLSPTAEELVATGGEVVAYFAGESAGFDSVLNLISPVNLGPFFPNHTTPIGTPLSLGTFAAGDLLSFRFDVLSTSQSFFTGPAAGNPDNNIHVAHTAWAADATIPVNGILVGFEDTFGGGDLDFNDNMFVLTNVATAVPEPSTALLGGAGMGAIALLRRRR